MLIRIFLTKTSHAQLSVNMSGVIRSTVRIVRARQSGGHSALAPPVPIPNTEVKQCNADDSAAIGCAKVGSRQDYESGSSRKLVQRHWMDKLGSWAGISCVTHLRECYAISMNQLRAAPRHRRSWSAYTRTLRALRRRDATGSGLMPPPCPPTPIGQRIR